MPKYLVQASYTPEAMKGLLKDGAQRSVLQPNNSQQASVGSWRCCTSGLVPKTCT